MSNCKISYNGSEISSVDETAPVSVAYNNATIATLNDGDTKTLGCNGKVMASDVVIGSKALTCNGKFMQGDIIIELVGSTPSGGETWYFNDTISKPSVDLNFSFTSKDKTFAGIHLMEYKWYIYLQYIDDVSFTNAYNYGATKWFDSGYRTIILDEPATGDVLAFLEANATKIS